MLLFDVASSGLREFVVGSIALKFFTNGKLSDALKAYSLIMLFDIIGLSSLLYESASIFRTFPLLSVLYIFYPVFGVCLARNYAQTPLTGKIAVRPTLVFLGYIVIACSLWTYLALKMGFY